MSLSKLQALRNKKQSRANSTKTSFEEGIFNYVKYSSKDEAIDIASETYVMDKIASINKTYEDFSEEELLELFDEQRIIIINSLNRAISKTAGISKLQELRAKRTANGGV